MRGSAGTWSPATAFAVGLLALTICLGPAPVAESSETLTGLVFSNNEVSLEGAMVTLEGVGSVSTDSAGRFSFRDVPPGNYRMTVSKVGFPEDKRLINVQPGRLNRVRVVLAGAAPLPSTPTAISVPVIQQGSAILVRGRVNEKVETIFLVDTGATYCLLTKATADRLALSSSPASTIVKLNTASGTIEAPLILIDLIQVGGAEVRSVEAVVHDLPGAPSAIGGLLGLSFLNQFKVEINPGERVMLLSR